MSNQIDWIFQWPFHPGKRPARTVIDVQRAARNDPETSHIAADRIKQSGALGKQQESVLEMVRLYPGCTSAELGKVAAIKNCASYEKMRSMYARRLPELALLHVERGESRICCITNAKCVTWWPR